MFDEEVLDNKGKEEEIIKMAASLYSVGAPLLLPLVGGRIQRTPAAAVSLSSFGLNATEFVAGKDRDEAISQALLAMLSSVVAGSAVFALANPLTFTWVSKEYYAPALGGIMLSIGLKLSIDDFSLAF